MTIMDITTIKRSNLADEVASLLQRKITLGEFKLGEKLPPEPELMQLFGVGRSTIREAVRTLSIAGMVRVQQGLGTFVAEQQNKMETLDQRLQRAKGAEINEVRQLLELKIAQKAALNRTEEDIKKIKIYLSERHEHALANDARKCIEADILFHRSIAEASQNAILTDLYHSVAGHLKDYFLEIYITTESFIHTQELHEALLQSIVDRDPKKAWEWASKITHHNELND
jgi:DNA-binding FadR family transcriptional regulator